jgi:hypothetical protein
MITEAAINQISAAAKKFPKDEPNILYLGLPFVDGRIFLDQVDMIYPAIFHEINRRRKRVNAVVLMAKVIDLELASLTGEAVRYERYVVPSTCARTPLPSWFRFPWSNMQQDLDVKREGTLTLDFQPHIPLLSQRGATLFWASSATAKSQIHVWQNYHNRLRFDVTAGELPKFFVDADVSDIEASEKCMAALTWKDNDINLMLFTPKGEKVFRPISES